MYFLREPPTSRLLMSASHTQQGTALYAHNNLHLTEIAWSSMFFCARSSEVETFHLLPSSLNEHLHQSLADSYVQVCGGLCRMPQQRCPCLSSRCISPPGLK